MFFFVTFHSKFNPHTHNLDMDICISSEYKYYLYPLLHKGLFGLYVCKTHNYINCFANHSLHVCDQWQSDMSEKVWLKNNHEGFIQGLITLATAESYEVTPFDQKYSKQICVGDDLYPSCTCEKCDHNNSCSYQCESESKLHTYNNVYCMCYFCRWAIYFQCGHSFE